MKIEEEEEEESEIFLLSLACTEVFDKTDPGCHFDNRLFYLNLVKRQYSLGLAALGVCTVFNDLATLALVLMCLFTNCTYLLRPASCSRHGFRQTLQLSSQTSGGPRPSGGDILVQGP